MEKIFLILVILSLPTISALDNSSMENVCDKIFFFILNKTNYTGEQIMELDSQIPIDEDTTRLYINNYTEICANSGFGQKLPTHNLEIPTLVIYKQNCSYEINKLLKINIPILKISIGEKTCKQLKIYSYFFELEKDFLENKHFIKGIRLYILITMLILIICFQIFRENSRLNKLIEKHK